MKRILIVILFALCASGCETISDPVGEHRVLLLSEGIRIHTLQHVPIPREAELFLSATPSDKLVCSFEYADPVKIGAKSVDERVLGGLECESFSEITRLVAQKMPAKLFPRDASFIIADVDPRKNSLLHDHVVFENGNRPVKEFYEVVSIHEPMDIAVCNASYTGSFVLSRSRTVCKKTTYEGQDCVTLRNATCNVFTGVDRLYAQGFTKAQSFKAAFWVELR